MNAKRQTLYTFLLIIVLHSNLANADSLIDFCLMSRYKDKFGIKDYVVRCSEGVERADGLTRALVLDRPLTSDGYAELKAQYPTMTQLQYSNAELLIENESLDLFIADDPVKSPVFFSFNERNLNLWANFLGNEDHTVIRVKYSVVRDNFKNACEATIKSYAMDDFHTMIDQIGLRPLSPPMRYPINYSYWAGTWYLGTNLYPESIDGTQNGWYQAIGNDKYEVSERCHGWKPIID